MSSVSKGRRIERIIEKQLIEKGYYTHRPVWTKFSHKDIFGLFDIFCMNDRHVRLIQSKSNYVSKEVVQKIREFKVPENVKKEIWIYQPRKPFRIIEVS